MKNNLKAFTLVELLVSMIITGIVISMALYAFLISYKQLDSYRQTGDKIREAFAAFSVLGNDVENAVNITGNERKIILSSITMRDIIYEFREKYFTRENGTVIDTFFITNSNMRVSYIEPDNEEQKLISEIFIESSVLAQNIPFHYYKKYDSSILMKMENKK